MTDRFCFVIDKIYSTAWSDPVLEGTVQAGALNPYFSHDLYLGEFLTVIFQPAIQTARDLEPKNT